MSAPETAASLPIPKASRYLTLPPHFSLYDAFGRMQGQLHGSRRRKAPRTCHGPERKLRYWTKELSVHVHWLIRILSKFNPEVIISSYTGVTPLLPYKVFFHVIKRPTPMIDWIQWILKIKPTCITAWHGSAL